MKHVLFAALATLPLLAAPAFANSENYDGQLTGAVEAAPPPGGAGRSEAYQGVGPNNTTTTSNTVVRDSQSEATPVFAGQPAQTDIPTTIVGPTDANR